MGVVYGATHTLLGRHAAIKVLLPDLSRNQEIVNRFFNEARAATSIRHPGIVEVYDFGYLDTGAAYIAMELLSGQSLAARLEGHRRLPVPNALWLTRQIAGALSAAHAMNIVHRDLKPDNVFLVRDPEMSTGERIKLLDFGIAKLNYDGGTGMKTRTGAVMGTPTYMSPEQCRGVPVDARADLYSLGCLLFEMCCGRPPFSGEGMGDILASHITRPPPRPRDLCPDVPEPVEDLILFLLEKDPAARAQTSEHVIAMIDEIAAHLPPPRAMSMPGAGAPTMLVPTPPPSYRTPVPPQSTRPPSYRTPAPSAPSLAPTTLTGAAGSVDAAPAPRSRRGLVIGITAAVAAGGIALAIGLAGGGGGSAAPAAEPAAAPAAAPAPVAVPEPEPVKIEPLPPPEPEPVKVEPEPEPVAEPAPVKKDRKRDSGKKKKRNRNAAYNPFE